MSWPGYVVTYATGVFAFEPVNGEIISGNKAPVNGTVVPYSRAECSKLAACPQAKMR